MRFRPLVVPVLVALGGCYTYANTTAEQLPIGASVRVNLTATGADRLADALPGDGRSVEGQVLQRTATSLTLAVPQSASGTLHREPVFQNVDLTPADYRGLELRRFDGVRTGLLVGGLVAAAAAVVRAEFWTQRAGGSTPPGGPPEQRIPLLRIPLGR